MPILLILLGLTVVGLPLALLGIALYFTIWLIANIVVGEFLGHKLFHQRSNTLALLAGLLLIVVVAAVPVIGPISISAVLLFGVGAISQTVARGVGAGSRPHGVGALIVQRHSSRSGAIGHGATGRLPRTGRLRHRIVHHVAGSRTLQE